TRRSSDLTRRTDLNLVLDVWMNEPRIDAVLAQRCFLATPHIAGYSYDAKLRGTDAIYRACCRFLDFECRWNYHVHLPPGRELALDPPLAADDLALMNAVLAVYDPREDDGRLRE